MVRDPVCGMQVDAGKSLRFKRNGQEYYFCSRYCRDKFAASSDEKTQDLAGAVYTCPMHPEVNQDHPGDCPKCGMRLETVSGVEEDVLETRKLLLSLFWGGLFTFPLLLLVFGDMLPRAAFLAFIPVGLRPVLQLIFATPVVLWTGALFFRKAWQSILSRNLNMFTLIALGVGVAYVYSAAAVLFPRLFPPVLSPRP
jgi:Cu+-exporting ATPase